jgi:hypothetical protein
MIGGINLRDDILIKIYQNPEYLEYLRYHPKWYQYLDQNPENFSIFEQVVKKELKRTSYDKIERLKKHVNFANALIKYLSK